MSIPPDENKVCHNCLQCTCIRIKKVRKNYCPHQELNPGLSPTWVIEYFKLNISFILNNFLVEKIYLIFLWLQGVRKSLNKDDMKLTAQAIEKAHQLCIDNKTSSELLPEIGTLFQCIK